LPIISDDVQDVTNGILKETLDDDYVLPNIKVCLIAGNIATATGLAALQLFYGEPEPEEEPEEPE
jgi:hypothetical protein